MRTNPCGSSAVGSGGGPDGIGTTGGITGSGSTDLVSRLVVCVPTLRLKLEEDGNPLSLRREVNDHAAVLPHTIIADEIPHVALIHVDVVDAVAGKEAEVLVLLVILRSPALAECIDYRLFVGDSALHDAINLLVEIVIKTGNVERQRPHFRAVEEVPADVVESGCPWLARDFSEAERNFLLTTR